MKETNTKPNKKPTQATYIRRRAGAALLALTVIAGAKEVATGAVDAGQSVVDTVVAETTNSQLVDIKEAQELKKSDPEAYAEKYAELTFKFNDTIDDLSAAVFPENVDSQLDLRASLKQQTADMELTEERIPTGTSYVVLRSEEMDAFLTEREAQANGQ